MINNLDNLGILPYNTHSTFKDRFAAVMAEFYRRGWCSYYTAYGCYRLNGSKLLSLAKTPTFDTIKTIPFDDKHTVTKQPVKFYVDLLKDRKEYPMCIYIMSPPNLAAIFSDPRLVRKSLTFPLENKTRIIDRVCEYPSTKTMSFGRGPASVIGPTPIECLSALEKAEQEASIIYKGAMLSK